MRRIENVSNPVDKDLIKGSKMYKNHYKKGKHIQQELQKPVLKNDELLLLIEISPVGENPFG